KEHAQFTVASDKEDMVQVEKSGTETEDGVELKDHSTPPSCFKHSPVTISTSSNSQSTLPPLAATLGLQISTSQKDSYTIFSHSSPDATSISASTLAGSSPAQTSLQIMEGVSSDIIFNEGIMHSRIDPLTMTFQATESNQEFQGMDDSAWKRETKPKGSRFL
ncbi:unnamed protein product, partial [Brassica napus]